MWKAAGTTDTRDEYSFLQRQLLITANPLYCGKDSEVTATGTPTRNTPYVVFKTVLFLADMS
jgi:hypothetical protein